MWYYTRQESIRSNRIRVIALVVWLVILFLLTITLLQVLVFFFISDLYFSNFFDVLQSTLLYSSLIVFFRVLIWSYYHQDMIFSLTNSKLVERKDEKRVYNIVENLCIMEWIAMPSIGVIPIYSYNAYSTGWSESDACIVFTKWMIQKFSDEELKAIAAHELINIRNNEGRMIIIIMLFAWMLTTIWSYLFKNIVLAKKSWSRKSNKGGFSMIILFLLISWIIYLVWYICVPYINLLVSHKKKLIADTYAYEMTKNKNALISALNKSYWTWSVSDLKWLKKSFFGSMFFANPDKKSIKYDESLRKRIEHIKSL